MTKLEIANVVSSGRLGRELDLAAVSESPGINNDSRITSVEHSRSSGERVLVRFEHLNSLGILSRTGACIITGARYREEANETEDVFIDVLQNEGIISNQPVHFAIQNIVFTITIDDSFDLNAVSVSLGLENVEYEPEQFPGLVYRPEETACVLLLFGSGKAVVTGARTEQEAREAVEAVNRELETL